MFDGEAVAGGFAEAGIDLQFEASLDAPEEGVAQVHEFAMPALDAELQSGVNLSALQDTGPADQLLFEAIDLAEEEEVGAARVVDTAEVLVLRTKPFDTHCRCQVVFGLYHADQSLQNHGKLYYPILIYNIGDFFYRHGDDVFGHDDDDAFGVVEHRHDHGGVYHDAYEEGLLYEVYPDGLCSYKSPRDRQRTFGN
jgi:hypothetical protein